MHTDADDRTHAHPELAPSDEGQTDATPPPEGDGLDLLTIGLVVFFLALIATVGALLILPAVL
jgi:hypothetical protein